MYSFRFTFIDLSYAEIGYGVYQMQLGISPSVVGVSNIYWTPDYNPSTQQGTIDASLGGLYTVFEK